jgi:hypothetical protein
MTELEEAELTDGQGRALSGHAPIAILYVFASDGHVAEWLRSGLQNRAILGK